MAGPRSGGYVAIKSIERACVRPRRRVLLAQRGDGLLKLGQGLSGPAVRASTGIAQAGGTQRGAACEALVAGLWADTEAPAQLTGWRLPGVLGQHLFFHAHGVSGAPGRDRFPVRLYARWCPTTSSHNCPQCGQSTSGNHRKSNSLSIERRCCVVRNSRKYRAKN